MLRRFPFPSRRILAFAVLAVSFHALMPLLMAVPARVGVHMEMCSTLGMRSVFVEFDTSGRGAPDKDLQARCPLCLAVTYFALMPPEDAGPTLLFGLRHVQDSFPPRPASRTQGWPAYHSRAPPAV